MKNKLLILGALFLSSNLLLTGCIKATSQEELDATVDRIVADYEKSLEDSKKNEDKNSETQLVENIENTKNEITTKHD